MARSTLADLIQQVRTLTYAGPTEYQIGTADYWDDQAIQLLLDRHRTDITRCPLESVPRYRPGGSIEWLEYRAHCGPLEATDGGTAVLYLEDSTGGTAAAANWSADYSRGVFTFATNQGGTTYYLTARSFDVFGAAAELLRAWANREKLSFEFSSDMQSFKRQQRVTNMLTLANEYAQKARAMTVRMHRHDDRRDAEGWY